MQDYLHRLPFRLDDGKGDGRKSLEWSMILSLGMKRKSKLGLGSNFVMFRFHI